MNRIVKLLFIVAGSLIMGLGLGLFLIPAKIAPGGVSGLATVINYATYVPVSILVVLINIPIFIVGSIKFSKKYMAVSFLGMIVLAFFIEVFSKITPITTDLILSSVYGGVFVGLGAGIVFKFGATTGGTDIIVMLLKKRFKDMSTGKFVVLVDLCIVIFAGVVFKTWETVLYSSVSMVVASFMVDAVVEGINYSKAVFIISDNVLLIADNISKDLSRGATCLSGFSPYTKNNKNVLLCVVRRFEISKLKKIIYETDKTAFVIVSEAKEVLGNGFKSY